MCPWPAGSPVGSPDAPAPPVDRPGATPECSGDAAT